VLTSAAPREALAAFRAAAPVRSLTHGGVEWRYRVAGVMFLGV
jgi:hypothetical protein